MNFIYTDKKEFYKNAKKSVSYSITGCTLLFVFQLLLALFVPRPEGELTSTVLEMLLYCISIIIPFAIVSRLFSARLKHNFKNTYYRFAPKKPFLYVIGAIGAGYIINLTISLLFPDFVNAFSVEPSPLPETTAGIVLYFVFYSVFPAFIEEWAFRGVILKNLLPYGKDGAILISSLLFGIVHVDPPRVIFASVFGALLAICYEYTHNLILPIVIHFLNNAISVIVQFSQNNTAALMVFGLFIYSVIGIAIYAIVYYSKNGLKHKALTLEKPNVIGYQLSIKDFLKRFVFNYAFIPIACIYFVFFALYYFI